MNPVPLLFQNISTDGATIFLLTIWKHQHKTVLQQFLYQALLLASRILRVHSQLLYKIQNVNNNYGAY
jgi:hypothetical protein